MIPVFISDAGGGEHTVNALGQTTQVTASSDGGAATTIASNASYFPNGALKQFTYGNGIVHTMTQNARQLPGRSTDGMVLMLAPVCECLKRPPVLLHHKWRYRRKRKNERAR